MVRRRISSENILLLVILTVAFLLRFYKYHDFSLSNDELSALFRVQYDTFRQLVDQGFYVDGHPGGIQVLLFYWVKIFGDSPGSVRLPFVLMGVGAVYFIYRTGKSWFGVTAGLLAAALLATLEFPVLYSRIARPYGSGLFFILLLTWIWSELISSKNKSQAWRLAIIYGFANALCMYNHYFSFLMAFIIGVSGLFLIKRNNAVQYVAGALLAVILFSPHIYITANHLSIGGVGEWLGVPQGSWIFNHLFYIFNNSWTFIVVTLLSLFLLWKGTHAKSAGHYRILSLIWFLLPLITGYIYSRYVNPVLQHSVLIFSMPFLLLFVTSFAKAPLKKRQVSTILVTLIVFASLTIFESNFYKKQHFNDFRGVAMQTELLTNRYGKNNISYGTVVNHPWYLNYYYTKDFMVNYIITDNKGKEDILTFRDSLKAQQTPHFLFSRTKPAPPELEFLIRDFYPYIIYRKNFGNLSEVTLYSKDIHSPEYGLNPDTTLKLRINSADSNSTGLPLPPSVLYDSATKFSKGIQYMWPENIKGDAYTLAARATITCKSNPSELQLVLAVHDSTGATKFWNSSKAEYFMHSQVPDNIWKVKAFNSKDLRKGDKVKIYIYNPGGEVFELHRMKLEVYEN
ncbi:MAG: hypothetical protein C0593_14100 [Marinilabiliales bacterium]|nr:MAG: hypothetical protein C0593_14100 [Marinilabiliales bacterium]